jgi:hypothetical protein
MEPSAAKVMIGTANPSRIRASSTSRLAPGIGAARKPSRTAQRAATALAAAKAIRKRVRFSQGEKPKATIIKAVARKAARIARFHIHVWMGRRKDDRNRARTGVIPTS